MSSKIGVFIPTLNGGGAEKVMLNLAKGLVNKGFEVDLVLAKREGAYLSQVPSNINIIDLKASRVLFALPKLVKYLNKTKPKYLLSALEYVNIIALLAGKLAREKTKIMVTEHSTFSRNILDSTSLRLKVVPFLMKLLYKDAHSIVAVSHGVADDLANNLQIPKEKIKVIYNPIINNELIEKSQEEFLDPWFHPESPPVILSVGRLTEAKDYGTLIKAFAEVHKKIRARLIILGDGEKRQELEELIHQLDLKDFISLPGFVKNPYKYMRNAKVFVLSSKWEGLPTVLVEAMACGPAVISTDCPSGPREILQEGKYGKLVEVGNPHELGEAIIEVINEVMTSEKTAYPQDYYEHLESFRDENVLSKYIKLLN